MDPIDSSRLPQILECLLFVAAEPVSADRIAGLLDRDTPEIEAALEAFRHGYGENGGLQVVHIAGGYQLRTRPEYASVVEAYLKPAAQRLSSQALETLAIIAYRQPVTVPEIDSLRGVSSGGVVKTLFDRKLIREVGRKDVPGRPILYETTEAFLTLLGLSELAELPRLEEAGDGTGTETAELVV